MNASRAVLLLVAKDLRIEGRSRRLGTAIVLGLLITAALALGLPARGPGTGPAILWVAYLFSGILCFERSMAIERHDDALAGLLLAPIDRSCIFAAKLLTNLLSMLAVAVVVTAAGAVFFGLDSGPAPWMLAGVLLLSLVGLAAVGTLFSAAAPTRPVGGLLPLLVFPLSLPLVIVSTHQMLALSASHVSLSGLPVLIAFDLIFLAAGWLMFEALLDP